MGIIKFQFNFILLSHCRACARACGGGARAPRARGGGGAAATLVERFDIEPFSDFSAK